MIYGTDIYETRRHIHVTYKHKGDKISCKFWLEPEIILDENKKGSFTAKELSEMRNLIVENQELLDEQSDLFYSNKQVKAIKK